MNSDNTMRHGGIAATAKDLYVSLDRKSTGQSRCSILIFTKRKKGRASNGQYAIVTL